MPQKNVQTRQNHVRFDPAFHFFLVPAILLLLGYSVVRCFKEPSAETVTFVLLLILLFVAVGLTRIYALRVQDRVIRLEERLRLATLLPESRRQLIPKLTASQLVALRFAADDEVAALAESAVQSGLTNRQIKDAIHSWRGDHLRV